MKTWVNLVVLMAIIQLVSIFWISRTVSKSSFESGYKSGVMACDNKWLSAKTGGAKELRKLSEQIARKRRESILSEFNVYP